MNVGENNTVTISVEEYRKLLEIQVRTDILKECRMAVETRRIYLMSWQGLIRW